MLITSEAIHSKPAVSFHQPDDDTSSSIYDVPPLPGGEGKNMNLAQQSGGEKIGDKMNLFKNRTEITAGLQHLESGTECGDESGFKVRITGPSGPTASVSSVTVGRRHDLSGRSRALLKQYFDDARPFSFPLGHPTVAFTESHLYHLPRILTDETFSHSFTTMEQLVLNAVKGRPAVAPSRTTHFKNKARAQTSRRASEGDSSSEGTGTESTAESENVDVTAVGDSSEYSTSLSGSSPRLAARGHSYQVLQTLCIIPYGLVPYL